MKKTTILILISLFFFAGTSYSQLKVDANGYTIFGANKVFNNGISIYDGFTATGGTPFKLFRTTNDNVYLARNDVSRGMMFKQDGNIVFGDNGYSHSLQIYPGFINLIMNSSTNNVGINIVQRSLNSIPVVIEPVAEGGDIITIKGYATNFNPTFQLTGAGSMITGRFSIFRMLSSSTTPRFEVKTNGNVLVNGTVVHSSDALLKKNIETIESPLSKILQLRGVTYDRISPEEEARLCGIPFSSGKTPSEEVNENITPEVKQKIAEEEKRKVMGVIAQEVEKVVPEVIKTYENGLMGVAYNQLIGLLIEGIKEQQTQITELMERIEILEENKIVFSETELRSTTGNTSIEADLPAELYQNIPNPFSQTTRIGYYLPSTVQTAFLCVYDLQGKQIKRYTLNERGENNLVIEGFELTPGMYLYALIADGQEVEVKRMILTE